MQESVAAISYRGGHSHCEVRFPEPGVGYQYPAIRCAQDLAEQEIGLGDVALQPSRDAGIGPQVTRQPGISRRAIAIDIATAVRAGIGPLRPGVISASLSRVFLAKKRFGVI